MPRVQPTAHHTAHGPVAAHTPRNQHHHGKPRQMEQQDWLPTSPCSGATSPQAGGITPPSTPQYSTRASLISVASSDDRHVLGPVAPMSWRETARYRHSPYGLAKGFQGSYPLERPAKTSAMVWVEPATLPDSVVLRAEGNTPNPTLFLGTSGNCIKYSREALQAAAAEYEAMDAALADAILAGTVASETGVQGQTGYTMPPGANRGVLAVMMPGVAVAAPTAHHAHGSRVTLTGLNHFHVAQGTLAALVSRCHQQAYYDVDGVWIAKNAEGTRELALFERVMQHYKNGTRTGRPMAPMTLEAARSQTLQ